MCKVSSYTDVILCNCGKAHSMSTKQLIFMSLPVFLNGLYILTPLAFIQLCGLDLNFLNNLTSMCLFSGEISTEMLQRKVKIMQINLLVAEFIDGFHFNLIEGENIQLDIYFSYESNSFFYFSEALLLYSRKKCDIIFAGLIMDFYTSHLCVFFPLHAFIYYQNSDWSSYFVSQLTVSQDCLGKFD